MSRNQVDLSLEALADDVRYAGGNGTSDYWRGFNDGIDQLVKHAATLDAARAATRVEADLRAEVAAIDELSREANGFPPAENYRLWMRDINARARAMLAAIDDARLARDYNR